MNRWSFHYLTSLGLAVASVVLQIAVFRFRSHDGEYVVFMTLGSTDSLSECLTRIGQQPQEKSTSTDNNFKQIFRQKNVHILAVFSLIHVGVEVTIGGWIVSYIIDERGGGPDSGYISSGFFGGECAGNIAMTLSLIHGAGLMMGRLVLLWLNAKVRPLDLPLNCLTGSSQIGEWYAIFLYAILAIA